MTLKDIKEYANADEIWARVKQWQEENNTSALPTARDVGLEPVGISYGTYGANGILFRDLETGEMYGSPKRDYLLYLM